MVVEAVNIWYALQRRRRNRRDDVFIEEAILDIFGIYLYFDLLSVSFCLREKNFNFGRRDKR